MAALAIKTPDPQDMHEEPGLASAAVEWAQSFILRGLKRLPIRDESGPGQT